MSLRPGVLLSATLCVLGSCVPGAWLGCTSEGADEFTGQEVLIAPDGGRAGGAASEPTKPSPPAAVASACDDAVELRAHAHAVAGDVTPFEAPSALDVRQCFVFAPDSQSESWATQLVPIIDNPRIVHHLQLIAVEAPSDKTFDGKVARCRSDEEPLGYSVAFWTPGNGDTVLPEGVGLRLPHGPGQFYMVEIHYNTLGVADDPGASRLDRSGFRICRVNERPDEEAVVHWLGTQRLSLPAGLPSEASHGCGVQGPDPVSIVAVLPHMHLLGRRMRIDLVKRDGSSTVLHDAAFTWEHQTLFPVQWTIAPGERLVTTCYYQNDSDQVVPYGDETHNEMCYAFVTAYPAGRLRDPLDAFGFPYGCIQR